MIPATPQELAKVAAIDLRRKQLIEELALLASDRGLEYAEFLGQDRDLLIRRASDEFTKL